MADDRRTFAPRPQPVTFLIQGTPVAADLYNFLDLPVKDSLTVYALEDEMRAASDNWADLTDLMRRIVRLLCPGLDDAQVDALTPRQLQEAIGASHGVPDPLPEAGAGGAASPSASAASTTPSP